MHHDDKGGLNLKNSVLLTGASGKVARVIRPYMLSHFGTLVLTDKVEPQALSKGEKFIKADLTNLDESLAAFRSVDTVVHFAGLPGEGTWDQVLEASVKTTINALEAARLSGASRFVFASSNHANGYYPRSEKLDGNERVLPDSRYGVAKVFGEGSLALYADKYGMKCMSIRIGTVIDRPRSIRELSTFNHPEDLAQLIAIGAEHPDVRNDIVFGLSDNERSWCDNSRAEVLGYRAKHKAEDHLDFACEGQKSQPDNFLSDKMQGGSMASDGFDGDSDLIDALVSSTSSIKD